MDASLSRNSRIEYRRNVLRKIIEEQGRVPSLRDASKLMRARGIEVSHVMIGRYLREIEVPESRELSLFGESIRPL